MAGLFSRLKIWNNSETLASSDLNAEFDHFLANVDASHSEGYSQNLSQMQTVEDPGDVGSENLTQPISTAQEIQRLRYKIDEIIGGAEWYSTPPISLSTISSSNALNLPGNRLIDCKKNSSGQPIALKPDTANSIVLEADANDPVIVAINGTEYTFTADISLAGLVVAPNTNNTCLNTSTASGGDDSKAFGQSYLYSAVSGDSVLQGAGTMSIGTVGANISALADTVQSFKLAAGGGDEYFMANVTASALTRLARGFFFDSSQLLIEAQPIVTGETITLMKTGYIFLTSGGALQVTYNTPFVQESQPTGIVGDYWFDVANDKWMLYDGSNWIDANATFIGLAILDDTNCVATRTTDIYHTFDLENTIDLVSQQSGSAAKSIDFGGSINVYGTRITMPNEILSWDLTTDVASGETAAAGTWYCYVTQYGDRKISRVPPNYRPELRGFYHPGRPWRAIGWFVATGASTVNTNILSSGSIRLLPRNDATRSIRIQEAVRRDAFTGGTVGFGQVALSGSSGTWTDSSGSVVAVTNLSVTLNCTGDHPVYVGMVPEDAGLTLSYVGATDNSVGPACQSYVSIYKNGSPLTTMAMTSEVSAATLISMRIPPSSFCTIDTAGTVGSVTYEIRAESGVAGDIVSVYNCRLIAFEIW